MRATGLLLAIGAIGVALTSATVATAQAGTATHLLLYLGAGVAWALALAALPRLPAAPGQMTVVILVAVAMRLCAWTTSPADSDDLYRYLWDGRVQRAGVNPYRFAPDAPELEPLRDLSWSRINHRELPTVYPPAAELVFAASARLPLAPLWAWKGVVAACDLSLFALLVGWLARRGGDPRAALAWGWSPLVAIELGENAHMDGVGILFLMAALALTERGRATAAGALLALSAGAKGLALALLPALRTHRARIAFFLVAIACVAPYAGAGLRTSGSLGEYGRRWRANDGAFALLHAGATAAVGHSRFAARYQPESQAVARLISGRDRDQVFPDEAANLLARLAALALFVAAVALAARRPPTEMAEVAIGAFLLLSPTLHPWYALWMVPLIAFGASPAWVLLAILVPLGYWPLTGPPGDGGHDPIWTRAVEHGLTWALLAVGFARAHRKALTACAPAVTSKSW